MSYQTYASWHDENDFQHTFDFYNPGYSFPILNKINIPVKIIVGTKDEFFHPSNPDNPQHAIDILLKNIRESDAKLIDGATHSYRGYEEQLVKEIINFTK